MNEPSIQSSPQKKDDIGKDENGAATTQLRELQTLLFGTETSAKLERFATEWDDPDKLTPKVSQVLPDAIAARSNEDYALTEAMTPYVVESIKNSARRNPEHISDAIFPILGPAIRKAVAQAFSNLTQTINQTLQHSFTARGLRWRMEAKMTGKSFAEVVLYHSLLYRVEQVFLIHRKTGLVLAHAKADAVQTQDADIVSGMLTAIQDFITDSFGAGGGEAIETLQLGEVSVLAERGPQAVLACVIRGTVPAELREKLQETLERIHAERSAKLQTFSGDTSGFDSCLPLLEAHLESRYQPFADPEKAGMPKSAIVLGSVLLALLLVGLFFWGRDRLRWHRYVAQLAATPGIVVTESEHGLWRNQIAGVRDPLAADPLAIAQQHGLKLERLDAHWEEFYSAKLALARAKKLLNPPEGITLAQRGDMLYVSGAPSQQWLDEAQKLAPFIPGIVRLQPDHESEIAALQQEIERTEIPFSAALNPMLTAAEIISLSQKIMRLDVLARQTGKKLHLTLVGHTDTVGTAEKNQLLSEQRAAKIRSLLTPSGSTSTINWKSVGMADREAPADTTKNNRRVTFSVQLTP